VVLSSGTYAFLISLIFVATAIFYFLEGIEDLARLYLVLATYALVLSYYLIKALYYLRHKATFNVVIFAFSLPLTPFLLLLASQFFLTEEILESFIFMSVLLSTTYLEQTIVLHFGFLDIFLLPVYFFSFYLLLRTHLRYPVIRYRGYSTKGFSPKFTVVFLTVVITSCAILLLPLYSNLLLFYYGITYLLLSIIGMLA
jgi:hypothetical protein